MGRFHLPACPSMPTPIPPSSTLFIPSHGIQSSLSPVIPSSSSSGIPSYSTPSMPTSSSRPAKHPFMPSSESIHAQDPPNIGGDSPLMPPCIDSDSVTQPLIHALDTPNVGSLDDLGRLIIVPDKSGFHPCTQARKVVVESMFSFYHGPWRFLSDIPWSIRDRMFDEFRLK